MLFALKRLVLGICLIAAASAVLLFSDLERRRSTPTPALRVAIFQIASTPILDAGVRGTLDALASRGFRDGDAIRVERFNAQGDMAAGVAIAKQLAAGTYDLVITSSTPALQAMANSNREGRVRHVFTLVTDPFVAGVGLDRNDPLVHPPHLVGQGVFPPVERALRLAREMLPTLERVGLPWNPAEANAQSFVEKARQVARDLNLTLIEANVDNAAGVSQAVESLVARQAQVIWAPDDNTVASAIAAVIAVGQRAGIPVITMQPAEPDRGTLFDAGANFYEIGYQGGLLAADVLSGQDLTQIPIRDVIEVTPPYLSVNTRALRGLKEPWDVPASVLAEASVVVDEQGIQQKDATRASATGLNAGNTAPAKTWRVAFVQLNLTLDVEEVQQGVLDGLSEAGLVEGKDFVFNVRNAHGDMATVNALIDAAVSDRADLIMTFSTPTLQAALQRIKDIPVVFTYVADAVAAGAGKNDADHVPNVTGVYLIGAYNQMMPIIKQVMPRARVLGTVYVPAEVNMVSQMEVMEKAVREAGLELRAVAANSASEVQEATLALVANGVDAISQLPGNLTAAAFPSMVQVARRARVPMFVFMTSQAKAGAVLAVARDYYENGVASGHLAARVIRGESTASLPLVGFAGTKLVVNTAVAKELGVTIPPAIVAKADEVIGQ